MIVTMRIIHNNSENSILIGSHHSFICRLLCKELITQKLIKKKENCSFVDNMKIDSKIKIVTSIREACFYPKTKLLNPQIFS